MNDHTWFVLLMVFGLRNDFFGTCWSYGQGTKFPKLNSKQYYLLMVDVLTVGGGGSKEAWSVMHPAFSYSCLVAGIIAVLHLFLTTFQLCTITILLLFVPGWLFLSSSRSSQKSHTSDPRGRDSTDNMSERGLERTSSSSMDATSKSEASTYHDVKVGAATTVNSDVLEGIPFPPGDINLGEEEQIVSGEQSSTAGDCEAGDGVKQRKDVGIEGPSSQTRSISRGVEAVVTGMRTSVGSSVSLPRSYTSPSGGSASSRGSLSPSSSYVSLTDAAEATFTAFRSGTRTPPGKLERTRSVEEGEGQPGMRKLMREFTRQVYNIPSVKCFISKAFISLTPNTAVDYFY